MFYYPVVLRRHSGCFSTVWLVATKAIKLPNREFLKVSVVRTCNHIMDYVLERVPPPQPGLPRPRFSLYLSSQLQYGLVLVFHRQCDLLLKELQTVVNRLAKKKVPKNLDLDDSRNLLLLPDALLLLQEAEGAPDPLFGLMELKEALPSPASTLLAAQEFLRETFPEGPEERKPSAAEDGITATPDSITLKESPPLFIPPAEFEGVDFMEDELRTIDILLDQPDSFPTGLDTQQNRGEELMEPIGFISEFQPTSAEDLLLLEEPAEEPGPSTEEPAEEPAEEPGPSTEEPAEEPGPSTEEPAEEPGPSTEEPAEEPGEEPAEEPGPSTKEPAEEPAEEPGPSTEEPAEEPGPSTEELGLSTEEPGPPSDQLTPVSVPVVPSPPSAAAAGRPESELQEVRTRRKQLVFLDPDTQLPEEEQKQQIRNPLVHTRPPVLVPGPGRGTRSAGDLLGSPCSVLPPDILLLWQQAAVVTPISGSELRVGEHGVESEEEHEPEMMEVPQKKQDQPEEGESSALDSLLLEASDQREASREISLVLTSEREGFIGSRSGPALQDIPEDISEDIPVDIPVDIPEDISEDIPVDVPVDVPVDIPVDISEDIPVDIPVDIPEDISEDIPVDVPVDIPVDIPVDVPVDISEDISEDVPVDIPVDIPEERGAAESPGLFPEFPEAGVEPVFFSSLLPPNVRRKAVSSAFHRLLGTLSTGRLRGEQDEAYGDILILPGSQQDI